MAAGLQFGCLAFRRAATPDTWGADIEVPEMILYLTRRGSKANPVGDSAPVQAARMFNPGAVTSGWTHKLCTHGWLILSLFMSLGWLGLRFSEGEETLYESKKIIRVLYLTMSYELKDNCRHSMQAVENTLRISGLRVLGPCDENAAISGAGFTPNFVYAGVIFAIGDLHKRTCTSTNSIASSLNLFGAVSLKKT